MCVQIYLDLSYTFVEQNMYLSDENKKEFTQNDFVSDYETQQVSLYNPQFNNYIKLRFTTHTKHNYDH